MQLNETFPIQKLILIIILFLGAWEVRANENIATPDLMGLAVRSADGVFILSDKEIPMANVPVNFFALFLDDVTGSVELDLSGPINFTRQELAEPYGLFSEAEFKSLPAGHYALTITVFTDGKPLSRYAFDFQLKSAKTPGMSNQDKVAKLTDY